MSGALFEYPKLIRNSLLVDEIKLIPWCLDCEKVLNCLEIKRVEILTGLNYHKTLAGVVGLLIKNFWGKYDCK